MVLATQNPIEQEGTYSLPEAQVDRFMFKLLIEYPTHDEEHEILRRVARTNPVTSVAAVATLDDILAMRTTLDAVHLDEKIELYILRLVAATRNPAALRAWTIWRRSSASGRRPAPASIWRWPCAAMRCCADATTWCPTT